MPRLMPGRPPNMTAPAWTADHNPPREHQQAQNTSFPVPALYTGVHQPNHAQALPRAMVSLNRLIHRRGDFHPNHWLLDSGAFSRISSGQGHIPVREYAAHIHRWSSCGALQAAVAQDWMCEPLVLSATGLTVAEHQRRSTNAWLELRELTGTYVMPVIQGYQPQEYQHHLQQLSRHLPERAWTGVGSICRRQANPDQVSAILSAILTERPDLRLHGFGLKTTSLRRADIAARLHTIDSMAWSLQGRYQRHTGNNNSLQYCLQWTQRVASIQPQPSQMALL